MESDLERDTGKSFGELFPSGASVQATILKLSTVAGNRDQASQWSRHLRFLTFDAKTCLAKSKPRRKRLVQFFSKSILRRRRPLRFFSKSTPRKKRPLRKKAEYEDVDPCCHHCIKFPEFPRFTQREKVRNFYLTEPGELGDCSHYAAISYRWASRAEYEEDTKYSVRTGANGTRDSKAPSYVIDRAVRAAAEYGIRLIWIDQECIDQDDREDKEFGIQSMDLVYEQAFLSFCMLTMRIHTKERRDIFKLLTQHSGHGLHGLSIQIGKFGQDPRAVPQGYVEEKGASTDEPESAASCLLALEPTASEVLNQLCDDPWFSRSWTFQELCRAGDNAILLAPCDDLTADDPMWSYVPGEITLRFSDFISMLIIAVVMIKVGADPGALEIPPKSSNPKAYRLIKACERMCWMAPEGDYRSWTMQPPLCNAAEAIQFLSRRKNSKTTDLLAIVANLCNYSIRLDTRRVMSITQSLSICIYTMAALNGDISLMACRDKEMISGGVSDWLGTETVPQDQTHFSWIPKPSFVLGHIEAPEGSTNACRMINPHLAPEGLSFSSFLFHINVKVEFRSVHDRYAQWKEQLAPGYVRPRTLPGSEKPPEVPYEEIYWEIMDELVTQDYHQLADAIWRSVMNFDFGTEEEDSNSPLPFTVSEMKTMMEANHDIQKKDLISLYALHGTARINRSIVMDDVGRKRPERGEWIVAKIIHDGYIWCGGLDSVWSAPHDSLCAMFDVQGPSFVLTPDCKGLFEDPADRIKFQRMSWIVESREQEIGRRRLTSKGMVRGMWNIECVSPHFHTLS